MEHSADFSCENKFFNITADSYEDLFDRRYGGWVGIHRLEIGGECVLGF